MTLSEIKNIKLLTTDDELRRVVEQINLVINTMNSNSSTTQTTINALHDFDYTKILVNKDGDVLTNNNGEVLLGN